MRTGRFQNCGGMTLPEVLVYAAITAVVLNLCAVTFVQTTRLSSLTTERAMRQQTQSQFARDFVRAVHGAARVLPIVGNTVTNESQVVLETPDGPVVVGVAGSALAIWRLDHAGDSWAVDRITSYPVAFRSVRFELDTANCGEARRVTAYIAGPARRDPDDTTGDRVVVAGIRVDGDAS